jgi:tRNA-guanine family transglycosylase
MGKLMIFGAGISSEKTLVGPVEAILLSAATVGESEATMRRTRNMLELLGWPIVMCDSGGFQVLQKEIEGLIPTFNMFEPMEFSKSRANISPKHVLEIAAQLDPTYLVCLDYPIRKDIDPSEFEREFYTKLDLNVDWATTTSLLLPEYGLDHERLLIPVQCYTIDQFEIFWSMLDGLQFGGLSMPIREMPNKEIVLFLRSMRHKAVQQVHILGSTKTELIAIGAFAARHYFDWLSLDATTWFRNALTQQYQEPTTLKNIKMNPDSHFADPTITCGCPWCRCYTSLNDIRDLNYADKCAFLFQHNFWAINHFAEMAYEKAVDFQTYKPFLEDCDLKNGVDALIGNLELLGT